MFWLFSKIYLLLFMCVDNEKLIKTNLKQNIFVVKQSNIFRIEILDA